MTTIANEVIASTRALWQSYFAAEIGNIFEIFQKNPIILPKSIYNILTANPDHHIRVYFGLDSKNLPKAIAVSSFRTSTPNTALMDYEWNDITTTGKIFELYSGAAIDLKDAQTYIAKWAMNENNEFYSKAFIISRSNFEDIFNIQQKDYALLDFGIKKEIKIMTQASTVNGTPMTSPVFGNSARNCPPYCGKESLLNI